MVCQGHDSTLPVTVDDIVYHTRCVAAGLTSAFLMSDLPFQADATPERALEASTRCLQAGAAMVKLEGADHKLAVIRFLSEREIPVCAHLGLTPQSVLRLGGYKVQGKEAAAAKNCWPTPGRSPMPAPTCWCSNAYPRRWRRKSPRPSPSPPSASAPGRPAMARSYVMHDLLGMNSGHRRPRFVKDFLATGGSVLGAFQAYAAAVRSGEFPGPEHGY